MLKNLNGYLITIISGLTIVCITGSFGSVKIGLVIGILLIVFLSINVLMHIRNQ